MHALGFALFLLVGLMALWLLSFVLGVAVPMWLTLGAVQMLRTKRLVEEEEEKEN